MGVEALGGSDLFDAEWFSKLRARGADVQFSAGDPVFFQGDAATHVGLILSGHAKASSFSENGEEVWLGQFTIGEFFGHTSYLATQPMAFEIIAETDMTALIIPVSALRGLLADNTALNQALATDLAGRLDTMAQRLIEALTLSAKGRICAELIRLSRPVGIAPTQDIIRPNPVFVDLALRVNTTRETVSRTVSDLQKKGIVSREPGAILILSRDKLRAAVK